MNSQAPAPTPSETHVNSDSHRTHTPVRSAKKRRRIWIIRGGSIAAVAAGLLWFTRDTPKSPILGPNGQAPLTALVAESPFLQEVVERGEISSSSNVEIRCQVQSKLAAGTPIIQIVPEGSYVKKNDFLVKLDDSGLRSDLTQQQIATNSSRALMVEAKTDFEAAKLALEEYESGTFRQEEGVLISDQFVARENLRRAEEYLRYSDRLAARGYVTEVQLEADRFAVEKARKELENASTKLEVMHRYTKQKNTNRLKANVETAEARLRSRENSHSLDLEREKSLEDQLSKCVITAPTSGQVVYANLPTGEPLIAEGKLVRERQVIIRLPDPKRMQVIARINESRIDKVKVGMRAKIRLDAFTNTELTGVVRTVSEYPLPAVSSYSTTKEYGAEIYIDETPSGVRSGMTAQVAIEVQKKESAIQVPIQAVLERGKRFFCLVATDSIQAREVSIGAANEQSVIIEKGLTPGEQVILAPQTHEGNVTLPEPAPSPSSDGKSLAEKSPKLAGQKLSSR
ncbi:MAG: efflux RND transporter periplasmic adaptor subunit [Verrucomicrobiota bacterium]